MFLKQTISKLSRIRKIFERPLIAHKGKQGFQTNFNFLPKVYLLCFNLLCSILQRMFQKCILDPFSILYICIDKTAVISLI